MSTGDTKILILGSGPVARTLERLLCAERIQRCETDTGWVWPSLKAKTRWPTKVESLRLVVVSEGPRGISGLIRWHQEARGCPLARKVGCVIFGLSQLLALELSKRDVFGRIGDFGESFENWGEDLAVIDATQSLRELLRVLSEVMPLYRSAWQRQELAAYPLALLVAAITRRDLHVVKENLPTAKAIDWDALCYPHPCFENNAHAWANQIGNWLATVTVGVTPDWEEGISLFSPLLRESP